MLVDDILMCPVRLHNPRDEDVLAAQEKGAHEIMPAVLEDEPLALPVPDRRRPWL